MTFRTIILMLQTEENNKESLVDSTLIIIKFDEVNDLRRKMNDGINHKYSCL
jgi:hypothetical protein